MIDAIADMTQAGTGIRVAQRLRRGNRRGLKPRFVGIALVGGPLVVAGAIWASPADADEAAYINGLHKAGIHAVTGGDQALLQAGWDICEEVSWGASPYELRDLALQRSDVNQGAGGITGQQADAIVDAAIIDLCPDA